MACPVPYTLQPSSWLSAFWKNTVLLVILSAAAQQSLGMMVLLVLR